MARPPILVEPLGGKIDATWTVPGSKSMTNRGLVLAALSEGTTELQGVLHSDDTRHMANALRGMGIDVENVGETTMVVRGGKSKLKAPDKPLFIGNSGTTVRFLAAFAALVPGPVTFEGDEHMAKRPISDLVDALRQLDIEVECETGCPPLTVHGTGLPGGSVSDLSQSFTPRLLRFCSTAPPLASLCSNSTVMYSKTTLSCSVLLSVPLHFQIKMSGTKSSQYFSALLLSAGLADGPLAIEASVYTNAGGFRTKE